MRSDSAGFSLVELAIVILIFGSVLAFSVPAYNGFSERQQLQGAIESIAAQLKLARETAIGTGTTQTVHFTANFLSSDYHMHNGSTTEPKWKLPRKITFYWGSGTQWEFRMVREGRCLDSGMIILQDSRGVRDTVSVQASGLVLVH